MEDTIRGKKSKSDTKAGQPNFIDEEYSETELKGIEDEGNCGWFSCEPRFIQCFNNPNGYMAVYGMFMIVQGMLVNGYTNVIITTLERRFRLQSFQTGLIVVTYDIGYFLLCLFVTFYGNRGHRPRMLGIGAIVFGLGCLIFSIPHFTTDEYIFEGNYSDLCDPDFQQTCETSTGDDVDGYFYLFLFAMLLQGFGCIPLYTVGFAVLEDSLPKEKSALYIGITNSLTILGPVLGYIIGGFSLSIYVDFDTLAPGESPGIDSSDPGWVGAWWVGYLLAVSTAWVLVAFPMLGFPKELPGSAAIRSMRQSEVHVRAGEEITETEDFGKSIKDMPAAICTLFRNAPFLLTTFAGCSEGFIIAAFTAFLPKYIESQFSLSAGAAAFYAGVIAIPGGVFGTLLSAVIIQKLKLRTPGILKTCIVYCTIVLFMIPVCLMRCPTPEVAGVNVPYSDYVGATKEYDGNLTSVCNGNCGCQTEYFSPVCGNDNITYFSSCFAGCRQKTEDEDFFYDCSCVGQAKDGLCEESCDSLAPFLGLFFFIVMINFMTTTPALLVIMRCVPETQKSFAIGVQWWIVRALGSIPGPVVFGVIFDATCILWQVSTCTGEKGSCWMNDSRDVAIDILIASAVCKMLSVIFFSLALYTYEPVKKSLNDTDKYTAFDEPQDAKNAAQIEKQSFDRDNSTTLETSF